MKIGRSGRAPLDPSDANGVFFSVVKLCAQENLVVGNIKGLDSSGIPVVIATNLKLASVLAVEANLEDECLALLEDNFDLFDVCRQLTLLVHLLRPTLACLSVTKGDAEHTNTHFNLLKRNFCCNHFVGFLWRQFLHTHDVRD